MAQSVEAVVWDHVKALLADPAVFQTQYEQGRGDPAVDVKADQEREPSNASSPGSIGRSAASSMRIRRK